MKKTALLLLTLFAIPLASGCSSVVRSTFDSIEEDLKARLERFKEEAKEYAKNEAAKLLEAAEAKRRAEEVKKLGELDKELEKLAELKQNEDGTTTIIKKTWRDFDADKDESLSPAEQLEVSKYVGLRIAKMVAAGELSGNEAKQIGYSAGGILGILFLIYGAKKGKDALAKKVQPAPPPQT